MKRIYLLITVFFVDMAHAIVQDVSQTAQLDINVTLYPDNVALIKEKRMTPLKEGSNKLLIKDVPSSILMDSFIFQVLPPSPSLKVLEYSFQAPHITRDDLLTHSIGLPVQILPLPSAPLPSSAKLLAISGEDALVESGGMIYAVEKTRLSFPHLPYTLVAEPLITLKTTAPLDANYTYEIGYLAKGFSWDAGYTIIIGAEVGNLDLNSWINIHNESGMDIKKGHFRISHSNQEGDKFYTIETPLSLQDKATKNVSWFAAKDLKPTKSFRIFPKNDILTNEEGVVMKPIVETWLSVQNDTVHGMGVPLPQGVIKSFQRNPDGGLFYLGENKTPNTPIGKPLSLRVGSTKDITAEMRQTDYRKLGSQVVESGYRLDLKNTTDTPLDVTVFQNVTGEWIILRETHPHEEEENRLTWVIKLAAKEEASLRYRIRMNVETTPEKKG
jgi:hypothetical protein